MKLTWFFRILGWVLFGGGAAVIFLFVEGNPAKSTLGTIAFMAMIVGVVCTIASTLIRIWPKKPKVENDDNNAASED